MSTEKDASKTAGELDSLGEPLSDDEIAEAEAAVTLATLPDGERMPAHVRERVEASAKAVLGKRAKAHALKRAEGNERASVRLAAAGGAPSARSMQSTTSAGSQVAAIEPEARPRPTPLFAWAGWAFAAAAGIALVVSQSRGPSGHAAGGGPAAPPQAARVVDQIRLTGAGDAVGEVRYDRNEGTGVLKLSRAPSVDPQREALQLWISFDADRVLRPITLVNDGAGAPAAEIAFGAGRPFCQGGLSSEHSAPRCVAIHDVVVTREDRRGALVFEEARAVLRAERAP